MAITYNPYNWHIRKNRNPDALMKMIQEKEEERDEMIKLLYESDNLIHHESFSVVINDLKTIQEEINELWLESIEADYKTRDKRPLLSIVEYFSD